ncbi:PQQ-dependent sugar dehydrogenase [Pseudoalteromonas shioyasakiensis]|uniref:PQQ-dependent sugar dehydrogenase n=1 Tax=Pseudoalteromonas shioyasakiensis TaxID=1190813 RepID=UPI0021196020|nr:PQQ-dependent sugar dehydrogenase [Pseudoalteromonas shioyasakiensis]MCQ8877444.1 PQQ-dependent sugar dehydrogenase [Pseudoalteromonas shioyasakiensis]
MKKSFCTSLIISLIGFTSLQACAQQTEQTIPVAASADNYELELIAKGIQIPWGMAWLNEQDLLVTDRSGELRLIRDGKLLEQKITGVPKVHAQGQGGLLDIELDPNFSDNGWIYFSYSGYEGDEEGYNTSIMRAQLKDMALVNTQLLFDGSPNTTATKHYGSRIEFDNDGYLYFSIGDRGKRDVHPQSLEYDAGKIHRINSDGSIPESNPFVNQSNARKSIYSYGHRNPQGMAMHPETGAIWSHEHGPRGGDEINIVKAGANYGWPVITHGINYIGTKITDETSREGMEQPDWVWVPSIAPSGMQFVTSSKYPQWQGHVLVGAMKFAHLVLVELDGNKVTGHSKLFEGAGRVRSIATHPNGDIYLGIDGMGIYRIVPKA